MLRGGPLTAGSRNAGQPATTNGLLSPVRSICSCCCCQRLGGDRENMLHMIENASLEEALAAHARGTHAGHHAMDGLSRNMVTSCAPIPPLRLIAAWLGKNHAVQQKPAPVLVHM